MPSYSSIPRCPFEKLPWHLLLVEAFSTISRARSFVLLRRAPRLSSLVVLTATRLEVRARAFHARPSHFATH